MENEKTGINGSKRSRSEQDRDSPDSARPDGTAPKTISKGTDYEKILIQLKSQIVRTLSRETPGMTFSSNACAHDALSTALGDTLPRFLENPLVFVRLNRAAVGKIAKNMIAARKTILASYKKVMETENSDDFRDGIFARICGYDMACVLLLCLLLGKRSEWRGLEGIMVSDNCSDISRQWKRNTGSDLHKSRNHSAIVL